MQQENNQATLEELRTLESFVQLGCDLPYGPYLLFKKLANRYPRHFTRFMNKHWHSTQPPEPGTLFHHLPIARAAVDTLSQKLEHYLTHAPRTEEEQAEFHHAVQGLENRLWVRNFNDPGYTHFLDIDQCTANEEGLGILSFFYRVDGPALRIVMTGHDGANPVEGSMALTGQGAREILPAFLLQYYSEPGSHSGDNAYLWSDVISQKEFEACRSRGLEIQKQKGAAHNESSTPPFEFPATLVFGRLDKESIRSENGVAMADYYLLGEKVHEVAVQPGSVVFRDLLRGAAVACTEHRDLEAAVLHHCRGWELAAHPTFQFLLDKVCDLRRIYFEYPSTDPQRPRVASYPAGVRLLFRLPVNGWNAPRVLEPRRYQPLLRYMHHYYTTTLTTVDWAGTPRTEEIDLLELAVPLAEVYPTAIYLHEQGFILPQKQYRLIIQDEVHAEDNCLHTFTSAGDDPWKSYWIRYTPSR